MNIPFITAAQPTTVDQVLTAFNTAISQLTAVKDAQATAAVTAQAEVEAAAARALAASAESARAASVIKKIEALLA